MNKQKSELILDTLSVLEQAIYLLTTIDQDIYNAPSKVSKSGIGAHLRHAYEHFVSFIRDFNSSVINYDNRNREIEFEQNSHYAKKQIQKLISTLEELLNNQTDKEISVLCDSGVHSKPTSSTIGRELQFLISHTIHHYAIIAMICKSLDIPLNDTFGVAPSTLKYESTLS